MRGTLQASPIRAVPTTVAVDSKGRVNLAAAGVAPGQRFRVEPLGDGSDRLVLVPVNEGIKR